MEGGEEDQGKEEEEDEDNIIVACKAVKATATAHTTVTSIAII